MEKTPAELYRERVQRVQDAVQMRVPDRVPTLMSFGYMAAKNAGMTVEEAFYDCKGWIEANRKNNYRFSAGYVLGRFAPGRHRV